MARPTNENMHEIIKKYKTGQYTINALSRMYNVNKGSISRYIKNNDIEVDKHALQAIHNINAGVQELVELADSDNEELINEVIDILKVNNPRFAKGLHSLTSLILQQSTKILQKEDVNSKDISNISKAMVNVNEALQIFPKSPSFAQQINIQQKDNKQQDNNKDNTVTFKFI